MSVAISDRHETLTDRERTDFETHKATLKAYVQHFLFAMEALKDIRERRLYREEFDTFEAFCKSWYGFSAGRGRQIAIAIGQALQIQLETGVIIRNEWQARELRRYDAELQPAIASLADAIQKEQQAAHLTAGHIRAAGDALQAAKDTGGYVSVDGNQYMLNAAITNEVRETLARQLVHRADGDRWETIDRGRAEAHVRGVDNARRTVSLEFDDETIMQAFVEAITGIDPVRIIVQKRKEGNRERTESSGGD